MNYTIDTGALLKIVLHSAKFPTSAVNGVLLGAVRDVMQSSQSPPGSPRADAARSTLHIYDAIPLCHTFITLTPMFESALIQVV